MKNLSPSAKEQTGSPKPMTPKELIDIHLKDPGHVITEDEIKNVTVGVQGEQKSKRKMLTKIKSEELDAESKNDHTITPYDILSS